MQYVDAQGEDINRKKILVFEYITGGGLVQEELPASLANEGLLMLKALVNEFSQLSSVQLIVLLDYRIKRFALAEHINICWVSKEQSVYQLLSELITDIDYFWPIAPEMDNVLQKITQLSEQQNNRLLNSSSSAIAICSDKLATIQCLNQASIATVESIKLDLFSKDMVCSWVLKPKDGVGCLNTFIVSNHQEFEQRYKLLEKPSNYIIQPYIKGDSLSLSCLFKEGKAWLLCCNRQRVSIQQRQFELDACEVNIPISDFQRQQYRRVINQVAKTISGLWGYVGIDIIQTEDNEVLILEINPRLTTSYVGIHHALGMNLAKTVLEMVDAEPVINKTKNIQQDINLK